MDCSSVREVSAGNLQALITTWLIPLASIAGLDMSQTCCSAADLRRTPPSSGSPSAMTSWAIAPTKSSLTTSPSEHCTTVVAQHQHPSSQKTHSALSALGSPSRAPPPAQTPAVTLQLTLLDIVPARCALATCTEVAALDSRRYTARGEARALESDFEPRRV